MFQNLFTKLIQNKQIYAAHKWSGARYMHAATENSVITDNYPLEQVHIDEAIKLTPTLATTPVELWHRAHETFANHGIYTTNFLRIVTGNPSVVKRSPQNIVKSIEYWRGCQFGEKFVHMLIIKYPELLNISDTHHLSRHIAFLKTIGGTNKNIWKLLMNSPDLLEQNQHTIQQKFDYFREVMRIDVPEIIKSQAFSRSYHDIRCRHVFLHRLGLFTPRPLKSDPNEPTKNHRLYQIMDTSEKTFATKICHVKLDEYEAFKEIYAREVGRKPKDEDDDDELSD